MFAVGSIGYSLRNFRQSACVRWTIHTYTHLRSPDTVYDRVCRWSGRVFYLQLQSVSIFRLTILNILTCHRPTMSLRGSAVCLIQYSICNFNKIAYIRLTIHKYTHLPSPDTVPDRVCRLLDQVFPMDLWAVSILQINNPQICSFASSGHCIPKGLPMARSSILSTIILNCHCPTMLLSVFAAGLIEYFLWNYGQLAYIRLTTLIYAQLASHVTVSDRVWGLLSWVFSLQL